VCALARLAATVAALLALAPSAAQATDYCVAPSTSCTPANTFSDIQPALTAAEAPGRDRVLLGSRTYDLPPAGLSYTGDALELSGEDWTAPPVLRQHTTTSGAAALSVTANTPASSRSAVVNVEVVVAQTAAGAGRPNTGIAATGPVSLFVRVRAAPEATRAYGVELAGTASLEASSIELGFLPEGSTAVVDSANPNDTTSVRSTGLYANVGVLAAGGATVGVEGSLMTVSGHGLWASDGSITANNPVVRLDPQGSIGSAAFTANAIGRNASLDVRYATVVGGNADSVGVHVQGSSTNAASASLLDSIVRNPGTSLERSAPSGSPGASLAANYNAFHPSATVNSSDTTPGTFYNLGARTENPRFSGADGSGLSHDSPYIDAGHPVPLAWPTPDWWGAPRVVDGDADGTARADLGAYEYQRRAPQDATAEASPGSARAGAPIEFSGHAYDPDREPLTYSWTFDDRTTGTGENVSHSFATPGSHTARVTVTDATGLTAAASVTVTITAASDPSPVGRSPHAGDQTPPSVGLGRSGLRLTGAGRIAVPISCGRSETEACAGTITLTTRRRILRGRTLTFGRAAFTVQPGQTVRVPLKVSKRNARLVRRWSSLKVTLAAVVRDSSGNTARLKRSLRLRTR
jgi:hypothetical protein